MMPISNEQLYNRLRGKVLISKTDLDTHLIEIGMLILECNEAVAESLMGRDAAKRDLDFITANREMTIRASAAGGKITEAAIKTEITLSNDVQEAQAELDTCKHDFALWQGMVASLDAHQSALKALVQLAGQGYFSITSAATEIKQEMAEKRRIRMAAT
jgi:hypothetical protein